MFIILDWSLSSFCVSFILENKIQNKHAFWHICKQLWSRKSRDMMWSQEIKKGLLGNRRNDKLPWIQKVSGNRRNNLFLTLQWVLLFLMFPDTFLERKVKISKEAEKRSAVLALLAMLSRHSHLPLPANGKSHTNQKGKYKRTQQVSKYKPKIHKKNTIEPNKLEKVKKSLMLHFLGNFAQHNLKSTEELYHRNFRSEVAMILIWANSLILFSIYSGFFMARILFAPNWFRIIMRNGIGRFSVFRKSTLLDSPSTTLAMDFYHIQLF